MIVLGMDLSISCPGFCVADIANGKINVLHLSHIKTSPKLSHGRRLRMIFDHIESILEEYEIEAIAREKAIPAQSRYPGQIQTIMVLNKVVGISDLATDHHGYTEIYEIPPTSLKKKLTGSGSSDKKEVAAATRKYLVKPVIYKTNDESDAAAVVIGYGLDKKLLV